MRIFEHFEEGSDEVLVTSFTTHGTPLIRYRIGDSMKFTEQKARCTRGMQAPIVFEILGRRLDFLYTADGAKIRQPTDAIKKTSNAIIRTQFIQNNIGEIIVKLVVDKELYKPQYDDFFRKELTYKFGIGTKIIIEHVDEIPREISGKYRAIKNNIIESN
jgi:phenylacetate-CoA ligase